MDAQEILEALREVGMEKDLFVVEDGAQAIEYFSGSGCFADRAKFPHPDVLFLDLKMPKVDGFGVLEWLKRNPPPKECLLVVLSNLDMVWDIKKAYALGAHTFLRKPLRAPDVLHLQTSFEKFW